jgi:hypothetical protein
MMAVWEKNQNNGEDNDDSAQNVNKRPNLDPPIAGAVMVTALRDLMERDYIRGLSGHTATTTQFCHNP